MIAFALTALIAVTAPRPPAPGDHADANAPRPSALGQDQGKGTPSPSKKKKVIRLDAITVEGRIQKPQAFYILQRSNLSFDELNRTESFLPKVEKSVENEPF